jgi:hypothetical protein
VEKQLNHPEATENTPIHPATQKKKKIQLRLGWCNTSEHIEILRVKITYFNTHQGRTIPVQAYYRARGFQEFEIPRDGRWNVLQPYA